MAIRLIAASISMIAAFALPFAPIAVGDVGHAPLPQLPCNLPTGQSLIIWKRVPGDLDRSMFANETDTYNCRPLLETWHASAPTGPGFCTKIAWSNDNPSYIPMVTPAPPLKKVIDQVGDC